MVVHGRMGSNRTGHVYVMAMAHLTRRTLRDAPAVVLLLSLSAAGCQRDAPLPVHTFTHTPHTTSAVSAPVVGDAHAQALARVAAVHGGAGPWAMLGYRMGERALRELGLARGTFSLRVEHHTPMEVQYTCMADGAAAATGVSAGKMNLALVPAARADLATRFSDTASGKSLTLRPSKVFVARFLNVPPEGLAAAGAEVMGMAEQDLMETAAGP